MAAALVLAVGGCGGKAAPPAQAGLHVNRFDRDRAFADLRHQVELGPRPAGSAKLRELSAWLRDRLPHGRFEKVRGGYRNIVGHIGSRRGKAIVVAAHYDTKLQPGFVGANDGAGGTAAVLEIARALKEVKGLPKIQFVLFDGEESPDDNADFYSTGLRGSRPYARRHAKQIRASRARTSRCGRACAARRARWARRRSSPTRSRGA